MIGTNVAAVALTALSLHKIKQEKDPRALVPKASLLTAAFFVASSIRIPLPPPFTNAHLILVGMMGALLGWLAYPAIVVGLILQALVFGHGGITTIGVNSLIMGVPALLVHFLFQQFNSHTKKPKQLRTISAISGFVGVAVAVSIFYGIVIGTIPAEINATAERNATTILALSHFPIALIEAAFMAFVIPYLGKVRPQILPNYAPVKFSSGD